MTCGVARVRFLNALSPQSDEVRMWKIAPCSSLRTISKGFLCFVHSNNGVFVIDLRFKICC